MILTLFVVRDSVPFDAALGLVNLAFVVGVAGLVLAIVAGSRLGIALSVLSLGGNTFVLLVFVLLARALG
jgi:hypothetical protein